MTSVECVVCYNNYNKNDFIICCNHNLCRKCEEKLNVSRCPICRKKYIVVFDRYAQFEIFLMSRIGVIKNDKFFYLRKAYFNKGVKGKSDYKGKLNLNKYEKIRHHLQYKYELEGRYPNKVKDAKFRLMRTLLR